MKHIKTLSLPSISKHQNPNSKNSRMQTSNHLPPFLRLPVQVREKIYSYLLAPGPENSITTINYNLDWPFLDHPSSSTFTTHQLDICRCPQETRTHNSRTNDHYYRRYKCYGPNVRFTPRSGSHWLLTSPGPAFNVLHPASVEELQTQPEAGIIFANRQIYHESLPFLYRDRNFLLLTGICSRGRYQAYVTEKWLSRLNPLARSHITAVSLLCQTYEEDCRTEDASQAYAFLSQYIVVHLPRCVNVCLNAWSPEVPLNAFSWLFQKDGLRIFLKNNTGPGAPIIFGDAKSFVRHFELRTDRDKSSKLSSQQSIKDIDQKGDEDWELVSNSSTELV
jgi:hypothetical protein